MLYIGLKKNGATMTWDLVLRILPQVGAVLAFLWGILVWREQRRSEAHRMNVAQAKDADDRRAQADLVAQTRRLEATRPFLERQLNLYCQATAAAAKIATSSDRSVALDEFFNLYWGELAMVENRGVERAMIKMGQGIIDAADPGALKDLALKLAHACRVSLDRSWGVGAWTNPDSAASRLEQSVEAT